MFDFESSIKKIIFFKIKKFNNLVVMEKIENKVVDGIHKQNCPDNEENDSFPMKKKNLLIGCSGSVATIRLDQIIKAFKEKFNVKVIFTKNAKIFSDKIIKNYSQYQKDHNVEFYIDEDEYKVYEEEDRVLHIDVKKL
jgi:hypothetical protein